MNKQKIVPVPVVFTTQFFPFFWPLDPDPHPPYGSGSKRLPTGTGIIWIHVDPDPQHWLRQKTVSSGTGTDAVFPVYVSFKKIEEIEIL